MIYDFILNQVSMINVSGIWLSRGVKFSYFGVISHFSHFYTSEKFRSFPLNLTSIPIHVHVILIIGRLDIMICTFMHVFPLRFGLAVYVCVSSTIVKTQMFQWPRFLVTVRNCSFLQFSCL